MGSALLAGLLDQGGVAGVLGEGDGAAGRMPRVSVAIAASGKADGRGDADGAELVEAGALSAGSGVDGGQQAQVVEAGDTAV